MFSRVLEKLSKVIRLGFSFTELTDLDVLGAFDEGAGEINFCIVLT